MSVTDVVGSIVGVAGGYWFVAIVRHNTEKRSTEKLTKMGLRTIFRCREKSVYGET